MAAGSLLPPDVQGDAPQLPATAPAPSAFSPSTPPGTLSGGGNPNGPAPAGIEQPPPQKGQIATGPETQPEYDAKRLAKANTTLDILNAMKPKSRGEYMSWWEKQHGDIDAKYDHLQSQLGDRPADEQPTTKKEKFAQLLEFGLHLMKNSARATSNQGAVLTDTLADSIHQGQQTHQAGIQQQQGDYDAKANAIEQGRRREQAGIGTPESAMKGQETADKDETSELKDTAGAFKSVSTALADKQTAAGQPQYATGPDGGIQALTRDENGNVVAKPVTGIDGKPFKGRVLGREAGSGIDKGDPAAVRTYKYATGVLSIDPNVAAPILGVKPSGNPLRDHTSIYKSLLTATMGDTEKSQRAADQYVLDNYGAAGLNRARQTQTPVPVMPPSPALAQIKAHKITTFANGEKWTRGIDGKPHQIHSDLAPPSVP